MYVLNEKTDRVTLIEDTRKSIRWPDGAAVACREMNLLFNEYLEFYPYEIRLGGFLARLQL